MYSLYGLQNLLELHFKQVIGPAKLSQGYAGKKTTSNSFSCFLAQPVSTAYLFVLTVDFSPMFQQQAHHVCVSHVGCPVYCTSVLLIKGIDCGSLLQQKL